MSEEAAAVLMSGEAEEAQGFQGALAAFAAEDEPVGAPNAAPEAEIAKKPAEPEPEAPKQQAEAEPVKSEPEKLEEEFVEFTGKQKERFNSVYGALKRLERENAALQQRLQLFPYSPEPKPVVTSPQPFTEAKPKLSQFEDADQWADAIGEWSARKAAHEAAQRARQELTQHQVERQMQEGVARYQQFLEEKTEEGYQKFGRTEFDNVCADVVNFAPPGSLMHQTLFGLQRYADVVMELGKNLHEADRIARLSPHDQIYELKSLEKKIVAREELAKKAQKQNPTKVEAPGQGEEPRAKPSTAKLRQAAYASGKMADFARVFEEDPTL